MLKTKWNNRLCGLTNEQIVKASQLQQFRYTLFGWCTTYVLGVPKKRSSAASCLCRLYNAHILPCTLRERGEGGKKTVPPNWVSISRACMQIDLVTWPSLYMTAYLFLTGTACDFASWLMHADRSRLASRSLRCLNSHSLWVHFELKFQLKHQPALQKCITPVLEGAGFYRDTILQRNLLIINHINLQYHYSEMCRKTFGLNCSNSFVLLDVGLFCSSYEQHTDPPSVFFFSCRFSARMQLFFMRRISNLCSVPPSHGKFATVRCVHAQVWLLLHVWAVHSCCISVQVRVCSWWSESRCLFLQRLHLMSQYVCYGFAVMKFRSSLICLTAGGPQSLWRLGEFAGDKLWDNIYIWREKNTVVQI